MIYYSNDNEKITLNNDDAVIINNNSKVFIDKTNDILNEFDHNTITINKGNTLSYLSSTYSDIVYGNSKVFSINNSTNTKHLFLNDYNFPAAKYYVNGYKSNYSILLNDGNKIYWTPSNKGILVDDITVNDISLLPTRLNGFEATLNLYDQVCLLYNNYNGTLVLNLQSATSISADKLTILKVNGTLSGNIDIKNVDNLIIENIHLGNPVKFENIKNILILNNDSEIVVRNSNILLPNVLNLKLSNSFNVIGSISLGSKWDSYILSGNAKILKINSDVNNNIFLSNPKKETFTKHYINKTLSYESNLPIGSIVWWPEAWASFYPYLDKTYTKEDIWAGTISIFSYGDPMSKNWALCDGSVVTNSLYSKLYGLNTTPNYKISEEYSGLATDAVFSGHHYLTEPSLLMFPPNLISVKPTKFREFNLDVIGGDNKHKNGKVSILQNGTTIKGKIDYGNWRVGAYVDVSFTFNLSTLPLQLRNKEFLKDMKLRFTSYACSGGGEDGGAWWRCWNGGYVNSLQAKDALPLSGGKMYGLYNLGEVCSKDHDGILSWKDTRNIPKIALSAANNNHFLINCVLGNPLCLLKDKTNSLRIEVGRGINCIYSGSKGSDKTREKHNLITNNYLSQHLLQKVYEISLNVENLPAKLPDVISANICLQFALPTIEGWNWTRHGNYWTRWGNARNRDDGDSSRLYNDHYCTNWITLLSNVRVFYKGMLIPSISIEGKQKQSQKSLSVYRGGGAKANLSNFSAFKSAGFYRRLNPWIKINSFKNDEVLRNYLKKTLGSQEEVGSKVIFLRHLSSIFYVGETGKNKAKYTTIYNLNGALASNLISTCYVPDGYSNYLTNVSRQRNYLIQGFSLTIDPNAVVENTLSTVQDVKFKFTKSPGFTFTETVENILCNLMSCRMKKLSTTIIDEDGQYKNIYNNNTSAQYDAIFLTGNIPNYFTSQEQFNFKVPKFKNKKKYSDEVKYQEGLLDNREMLQETYTFYTCDYNPSTKSGLIFYSTAFVQLANNGMILDNVTLMIKSLLEEHGYINTTLNVPIFFEQDKSYVKHRLSGFSNYFMCGNELIVTTKNTNKIYFSVTYEDSMSAGRIAFPNTTTAYITYNWNPNITSIPMKTTYTSVRCSNNTIHNHDARNTNQPIGLIYASGLCRVYNDFYISNGATLTTLLLDGTKRIYKWTPEITYLSANTYIDNVNNFTHEEDVSVEAITTGWCNGVLISSFMSLTATVDEEEYEYQWDPDEGILPDTSALVNGEVVALNSQNVAYMNTVGKCLIYKEAYLINKQPSGLKPNNNALTAMPEAEVKTVLRTKELGSDYETEYEWKTTLTAIPPFTSAAISAYGSTNLAFTLITNDNTTEALLLGLGYVKYTNLYKITHETQFNQTAPILHPILCGNFQGILLNGESYSLTTTLPSSYTATQLDDIIISRLSSYTLYLSSMISRKDAYFRNYYEELENYRLWKENSKIISCTFVGGLPAFSGIPSCIIQGVGN